MPDDPQSRQTDATQRPVDPASQRPADKAPAQDRTQAAAPGGSPLMLAPGTKPVPGYKLVKVLGRGAFGEVWQATGPDGFPVAMKFLRLAGKGTDTEKRALKLMQGLRHPNLLGLHGAWRNGDYLIVAMELADRTLLDRLNEATDQGKRGIPPAELLGYMRQAAAGLDYLNSQSVQHRDVKPANLLLVGGGVKVGDFGLAKVLEKTIASVSHAMTPAYAAPEFFNGQASRWSDQYSLAVTYCQLRGGQLPFEGDLACLLAGHLLNAPNLEMLPAAERPAVERALAKKPEERWPDCAAFVEALVADTVRLAPVVRARQAKSRARRSRWPLVAASVAVLAALLLTAVFWQPSGSQDSKPASPKDAHAAEDKRQPLREGSEGKDALVKADASKEKKPPLKTKAGPKPEALPPVVPIPKIKNSIGMELVRIPAGKFHMGSPPTEQGRGQDEEQHEVEITEAFYMGSFEVT